MAFSTLHDIVNNAFLANSLAPQIITAATNGADSVDCTSVDGPINAILEVGATPSAPTSYSVTAKLQESDTGTSSWTDIVTQSTAPVLTAAGTAAIRAIRTKKYVRGVVTPTFVGGSTPSLQVGLTLIGQLRSFGKQPGDAGY